MSSFLYLTTEFHKTHASLRYVNPAMSSLQSNLGGLTWPTWSFLKTLTCIRKWHIFKNRYCRIWYQKDKLLNIMITIHLCMMSSKMPCLDFWTLCTFVQNDNNNNSPSGCVHKNLTLYIVESLQLNNFVDMWTFCIHTLYFHSTLVKWRKTYISRF